LFSWRNYSSCKAKKNFGEKQKIIAIIQINQPRNGFFIVSRLNNFCLKKDFYKINQPRNGFFISLRLINF